MFRYLIAWIEFNEIIAIKAKGFGPKFTDQQYQEMISKHIYTEEEVKQLTEDGVIDFKRNS